MEPELWYDRAEIVRDRLDPGLFPYTVRLYRRGQRAASQVFMFKWSARRWRDRMMSARTSGARFEIVEDD